MIKQLIHKRGRSTFVATIDTDRGYFSLTGEERVPTRSNEPDGYDSETGKSYDLACCGAMGEQLVKVWPKLAPIEALHLSSIETGEPMHGEANGWHWLSGYLQGFGMDVQGQFGPTKAQLYSVTAPHTPEQCRAYFASHCRITSDQVQAIAQRIADTIKGSKCPAMDARSAWGVIYNEMRPRFASEAKQALELIDTL